MDHDSIRVRIKRQLKYLQADVESLMTDASQAPYEQPVQTTNVPHNMDVSAMQEICVYGIVGIVIMIIHRYYSRVRFGNLPKLDSVAQTYKRKATSVIRPIGVHRTGQKKFDAFINITKT